MLIPSNGSAGFTRASSLSRRVNANSQHESNGFKFLIKLIKKGEC